MKLSRFAVDTNDSVAVRIGASIPYPAVTFIGKLKDSFFNSLVNATHISIIGHSKDNVK